MATERGRVACKGKITGFSFEGPTRLGALPSTGYRDVSDYDETTTGLALRPTLTLQPAIPIGDALTLVPFAGGSAFMYGAVSSWTVNEWEDELYGPDCFDGCPDSTITGTVIGDVFAGFDADIHISEETSLSLSGLVRPDERQDGPISEYFVVFMQGSE